MSRFFSESKNTAKVWSDSKTNNSYILVIFNEWKTQWKCSLIPKQKTLHELNILVSRSQTFRLMAEDLGTLAALNGQSSSRTPYEQTLKKVNHGFIVVKV